MSGNTEVYSAAQIAELSKGKDEAFAKVRPLYERFCQRGYSNERALEFATQGFARRIEIIAMCVENVFQSIPIKQELRAFPSEDRLLSASINIQASIINVFGSTDNLAWVWVEERQIKKDGKPLNKLDVGLTKECVSSSFSKEFQTHLKALDEWFTEMGAFRHGLAHRIPLYIPPSCLPKSNLEARNQIVAKQEEAHKRQDSAEYDRLDGELKKLHIFQPLFKGSFTEKSLAIPFHYQILTNLNTVLGLGDRLLNELESSAV